MREGTRVSADWLREMARRSREEGGLLLGIDLEDAADLVESLQSKLVAVQKDADDAWVEIKELKTRLDSELEKNRELHRRCQFAEGAVMRKMTAEQAAGAPIAKRLAMAGYAAEQEKRLELEGRLGECSKVLEDAARYIQAYHREYGGMTDKAGDGLTLLSRMWNAADVERQSQKSVTIEIPNDASGGKFVV